MRSTMNRSLPTSFPALWCGWVLAICCLGSAGNLRAGVRASANYQIVAEALPPLGGAASSASYSLVGGAEPGGAEASANYAMTNGLFVPSSAEMVVEVSGAALANGSGQIDFGSVRLGTQSSARVVTIRNVGDEDLIFEKFGTAGTHGADFTVDAAKTSLSLAPGETTTFDVFFKPAGKGARSADVFVTSNDPVASLFTSELLGEGVGLAYGEWQTTHFTADEIADASISGPAADPDHDGVNNLLEYAFGLDPLSASRAGLPSVSATRVDGADYLSITFTRSKTSGDLVYTIEASNDLATWTALTPAEQTVVDHGESETVVARDSVAVGAVPRRFLRVKVSVP